MPAFLMADVAVADMDAYRDSGYLEAVPRLAAEFSGRYRARGGQTIRLEGDWMPTRMILIEFPSMADLLAFYNSEAYAPWKAVRQGLTKSEIVAIDGVDQV